MRLRWERQDRMSNDNDRSTTITESQLKIALVEDHAILREGLKALIEVEPDLRVIGEAGNADNGFTIANTLKPDLVITDLALPGRSGISLITELRKIHHTMKLLVLTAHHTEEYIRAALKAGANGYVLKDASRIELLQGIRAVAAGRQFLCEAVSANIVSRYLSPVESLQEPSPAAVMTERERQVIACVALGHSNKLIARSLSLSVKTVEKHRSNMMRKLGLHNTAAVTMFAIHYGLVKSEEIHV
jgi:DNA-binding NarL/FixJ family response regulator